MALIMADGPVENLPAGLPAYAGYLSDSGIGETFTALQAAHPNALLLSISTRVGVPAMVADVEPGALSSWVGYTVGYCAVSNVNALIQQYGRPKKLWTAHGGAGQHICSPDCWPGLCTTADGTQYTQNAAPGYDLSILDDSFFDFLDPPTPAPAPSPPCTVFPQEELMIIAYCSDGGDGIPKNETYIVSANTKVNIATAADMEAIMSVTGQKAPIALTGAQLKALG